MIKVAQPPFLKLICLGSLLEIVTVLTLSFDEGRGSASQKTLDWVCCLLLDPYTAAWRRWLWKRCTSFGFLPCCPESTKKWFDFAIFDGDGIFLHKPGNHNNMKEADLNSSTDYSTPGPSTVMVP